MLKDLVYAFRILRKNPVFTLVAICSLGIGIGATTGVYSFAETALLRPLPVLEPSRIVTVIPVSNGLFGAMSAVSYPDYVDVRDRNNTFDGLVAMGNASFGFASERAAQPRMKFGMFVSGNFFQVLGIMPQIGRGFSQDEDKVAGRDAVVVLSHDTWMTEFGGDTAVAGRSVWLSGKQFTIVGVAPESFPGLEQLKPSLYVPIAMSESLTGENNLIKRDARWLDVKGRLKPAMGIAQARADVESIARVLRGMYPKTDANLKLKVQTEFQMRAKRSPPDTALVIMMSLLALCVLLVACANVTGLLLSRSTVRAREIALRMAVGASRSSLIRQLLLENLLLALAGSWVGQPVALGAVQVFNSLPFPTDIPINYSFSLDQRALLFALAMALLSTFLFGLTPAMGSTRVNLSKALKEREGTGSKSSKLWGRNLIVGGQMALSLVLLIVAAFLVEGFRWQLNKGPGYRVDGLQLMSFDTGVVHYSEEQRDLFYQNLLDLAQQTPGVESAALTSSVPMSMQVSTIGAVQDGRTLKRGEDAPTVFDGVVSPDYFRTLAIPLLEGRTFLESDKMHARAVAIVNEEFARHYWPKQSAIGKHIRLRDAAGKQVEVIGVAKTSKYLWITEMPMDFIYLPFAQNPQGNMALVAQSKGADAGMLAPALRQVVQRLDRNMPVFEVRTMKNLYEMRAVRRRTD